MSSRLKILASILACTGLAVAFGLGETVTLSASKDNTLYESPDGALSNGAGQHIFAGATGNNSILRAVLAFDLSGVPQGATINSAQLILNLSRTSEIAPLPVSLHRVLKDWGEGTSQAGRGEGEGAPSTPEDATWVHTFFADGFWDAPGGDFMAAASGAAEVGFLGSYTWQSTPQMVADVRDWVDDPSSNFGWLLRGEESRPRTAKRFDSRQNNDPANRPRLVVDFSLQPMGQPGTLQFTSDRFAVAESAGSAQVTVSRSGGSDGQVSVEYSAQSGTATLGEDFQSASGTLVFEDGQSGEMSFEVLILDDDRFEGQQAAALSLFNPSGGAALGMPSVAELVISDSDDLSNALYFAQFGKGQGLFSQITLVNPDPSEGVNARILLRDDSGGPLEVDLNGTPLPDGRLDLALPASGLRAFETDSLGDLVAGSATVLSDRPLAGVILFGGASGLAGVGASPESLGFSIPVQTDSDLGVNTGIAVQNLESTPAELGLELLDSDGNLVATAQRGPETGLPPEGHVARFVNEFSWQPAVDLSLFRGTLRVSPSTGTPPSAARVAATALQIRPSQLATLPVVPSG